MVMRLVIFPLITLSGMFLPLNSVPQGLQIISKANPVTYGVNAIRRLFLGGDLPAAAGNSHAYESPRGTAGAAHRIQGELRDPNLATAIFAEKHDLITKLGINKLE